MGSSVQDVLSSAKATLDHANSLTQSVAADADKVAPKPTAHLPQVTPKHEYSNAPYSLVKEAGNAAKGIKARMETESKARKAL